MKVLAKVLHVEQGQHKDKPKADVTLKIGSEAIVVTLWHHLIAKGFGKEAEAAVGREILADLQVEANNGRLRYSWGFDVDFSAVQVSAGTSKPSVKAAG